MTRPLARRLRSLDVLRGLTIAFMLLVNNAGDWGKTFAPLLHAEWHGWTPTDLVFPFFLFVMGVAVPFAFAARLERTGGDRSALHRQVVRRALILFVLGLLIGWYPFIALNPSTLRIPGVLQRIGVVYLLASLAYLHLSTRGQIALGVALILGYWAMMAWVPVPGFGAGDLSPEGNLAALVDTTLLGSHTWRLAPGPGDPEGLLSTLPAVATALIGILAGTWLRTERRAEEHLLGLYASGCLLAGAGYVFDWFFPINKNLWTSSYVVFTGGLALVCLALIYHGVDLRGRDGWVKPFEIYGTNSIAAFVLSALLARTLYRIRWADASGETTTLLSWLYHSFFSSWIPDYWASLAWALAHVALIWGVLYALHRRRIFLRI